MSGEAAYNKGASQSKDISFSSLSQSLLVFTVDLHNYTLYLPARDFEETRTAARGLTIATRFEPFRSNFKPRETRHITDSTRDISSCKITIRG